MNHTIDHDEAAQLLGPYMDGELDLTTALKMEGHLAECAECREKLAGLKEMTALTRDEVPRYEASPFLRTRIVANLREQQGKTVVPPWWRRPAFSFRSLATVAAMILCGGLIWFSISRGHPPAWVQEAVADHVRSLQVNHLMDVASTDQHTVKPWFAGKLDYSPQVIDLASSGYPLIGGRLDVLDGRNVSAIVYQRRKHYINLFIWPADGHALFAKSYQRDGYHVLAWGSGGMDYVAVSELGEGELQDFVRMIQDQTGASRTGE